MQPPEPLVPQGMGGEGAKFQMNKILEIARLPTYLLCFP